MMIFLAILKGVGIVLLVLAVIAGVFLFFPVSYEFAGCIEEGSYRFRLNWLFRLIRFRFYYRKKADAVLWILFFPLNFTDPKAKERRKCRKEKRTDRKRKKATKKHSRKKKKQKKAYQKRREKNRSKIQLEEDSSTSTSPLTPPEEGTSCADGEKLVRAAVTVEETAEDAGIRMPQGVRNVLHIIRSLYESEIFGVLFPKLQVFLIRICPKRLGGHLEFGFSDPALTGQVLGAAAAIPFLFSTDLEIFPDFETEKSYISGSVYLKGRMYGIHLVLFLLHVFRDKKIRKFISAIRGKE